MDKFNQDGNLVGRIGALAVIVAAAVGLGRLYCGSASFCPLSGMCDRPSVSANR